MSWWLFGACLGDFSALMGGGSSHIMSYAEASNHLDMNEMGKLATKYQHIKQDFTAEESGVLTSHGLTKYFSKKGMGNQLARGFAGCFVGTGEGEITFEAYVVGIVRSVKASQNMRHKFCFDIFKAEDDKYITKNSFKSIFFEFLDYSFLKCQVKLYPEESEAEKAIGAMFSGFSSPSHPSWLSSDEFSKWMALNVEVPDIIRYSMEQELIPRPDLPSTLLSKQVAVPPHLIGSSKILTDPNWAKIRTYFPKKYKNHALVLLYSTVNDGFSLITLYRKVIGKSRFMEEEPTLMVVRDAGGHAFGGFASEQWRKVTRDDFYGDEECFMFSAKPEEKVYRHRRTSQDKNFMFSSPKTIAMGGKKSAYGFSLDEDLYEGTSNFNTTYGCKCVASSHSFRISVVEVWGFIDSDEPLELFMLDVKKKEDMDKGSVLNDKKNTFILDLIGRGQSANVRDTD